VVEIIKTEQQKYGIDRVIPSGSIAKGTSLEMSDFDCVLIINLISPPYKNVLVHFKNILIMKAAEHGIELSKVRLTQFSIQFTLDAEFEVDLLVAGNLVVPEEGLSVAEVQQKAVLDLILRKPEDFYYFSSALCESQVEFMVGQTEFARSLVRLVKYWLKQLNLGPYRSGFKGTLELLAVRAAQVKENQNDSSTFRKAFRCVMWDIMHLSNFKVYFNEGGHFVKKLNSKLCKPRSSYRRIIPEGIRFRDKFVLDPANPFNDLAVDVFEFSPELYPKLCKFANYTYRKMDSFYATTPGVGQADIASFFQQFRNIEF